MNEMSNETTFNQSDVSAKFLNGVFANFDNMDLPPFMPLLRDPKDRFEKIRDFDTRPDDVILVAYPKSGTHWVWEIIHMLLTGKAEYTQDKKETVFMEAIVQFEDLEKEKSPRNLNTHAPYRWLPVKHKKNNGRFVHVIRNPKDIAVSMFHHWKSIDVGPLAKMDWPAFFDQIVIGNLKMYGGWFAYEKEFENLLTHTSAGLIHTLYYENLIMNPPEEIKRLADYLHVQYTDKLIEEKICNKTKFEKLKEADETLKTGGINQQQDMEDVLKQVEGDHSNAKPKRPMIYRKGKVGDWKNFFTVAQNSVFDDLYKHEMKESNLRITFQLNR